MENRKTPESVGALSRGHQGPGRDYDLTTKKLLKYARLKNLNCQIGVILGKLGHRKLQEKLEGCGRFLAFRQYLFSGELKLRSGYYCNVHLMCPCCSAARSRRLLGRWLPAIFSSRNQKQCRHYLLTLTWPPPPVPLAVAEGPEGERYKLRANLAVGQAAWARLWNRARKHRTGPLRHVLGAILATEVTGGPGKWHPHFHILVTLPRSKRVDATEIRSDWRFLTGGHQLQIDVLKQESDIVEVFKYAFKPADLGNDGKVQSSAVETRLLAYRGLSGLRLVRGYGIYYAMEEPDLTEQETVEDLGEWVDLVFQWMGNRYELVKKIPGGEACE